MIDRGAATDDEMVLAFLRAEANSSRYGKMIKYCLAQHLIDHHVIYEPNLADAAENGARKTLLGGTEAFRREGFLPGKHLPLWKRLHKQALPTPKQDDVMGFSSRE